MEYGRSPGSVIMTPDREATFEDVGLTLSGTELSPENQIITSSGTDILEESIITSPRTDIQPADLIITSPRTDIQPAGLIITPPWTDLPEALSGEEEAALYSRLGWVSRSMISEHNKQCEDEGNRDNLWTVGSAKVYLGCKMFNMLHPFLIQQIELSAKQNQPSKTMSLLQKFSLLLNGRKFNKALQLCRYFNLSKDVITRAQQGSVIGNIVDDGERSAKDHHDLDILREDFIEGNFSECRYCMLRIIEYSYNSHVVNTSRLEDPNEQLVCLPKWSDPKYLRFWHQVSGEFAPSWPISDSVESTLREDQLRPITKWELAEHNQLMANGGKLWTTDGKFVFDGQKLFRILEYFSRGRFDEEMRRVRNQRMYNKCIFFFNQCKIHPMMYKAAKQASVIGKVIDDPNEADRALAVIRSIQEDVGPTEKWTCDFYHQLTRLIENQTQEPFPVRSSHIILSSDEFPLPFGVASGDLQPWMRTREPFVTTVDHGESVWNTLPTETLEYTPQADDDILINTWRLESEPFDTSLDEEWLWSQMEVDVIKNDEPTLSQIILNDRRDHNPNFNNPQRRRRRREDIFRYFKTKYPITVSKSYYCAHTAVIGGSIEYEVFEGWADRVERSWVEFEELCETYEAGYKAPRSETPCLHTPRTRYLPGYNPKVMENRRDKLCDYFSNETLTRKPQLVDQFKNWADTLQSSWEAFQDLCDS